MTKYGISRHLPDGTTNPEWSRRVYAAMTPEEKARRHAVHLAWQRRNPEKMQEYRKRCYSKPEQKTKRRAWERKWRQEYRIKHPKRSYLWMRRFHLKRSFNITLEEYEGMLKAQDYKCAICGALHAEVSRKRLQIDHCHKVDKIRALLCRGCNSALGYAKDDPNILRKAADYIEHYKDR
jgi:hypothetical protein